MKKLFICKECRTFSRIRSDFCGNCGAQGLRKARKDDYDAFTRRGESLLENIAELSKEMRIGAENLGRIDKYANHQSRNRHVLWS